MHRSLLVLPLLVGCAPWSPTHTPQLPPEGRPGLRDVQPWELAPRSGSLIGPSALESVPRLATLDWNDGVVIDLWSTAGRPLGTLDTGLPGVPYEGESSLEWHPDGWFVVAHDGELVRVELDGSVQALAPWNRSHYRMSVDGTGDVLIADETEVGRIDPATGDIVLAELVAGRCWMDGLADGAGSLLLDVVEGELLSWVEGEEPAVVHDLERWADHVGRDGDGGIWAAEVWGDEVEVVGVGRYELADVDLSSVFAIEPAVGPEAWLLAQGDGGQALVRMGRDGTIAERIELPGWPVDLATIR
jgi:hypothetical protein